MTKRTMKFWLAAIVLAFSPAVAYADAGTPLMWAGAFHLLLGNAIIGVGEGLILSFLFRLKSGPCVAIMIAANYFSAWVGGVFLISAITASLNLDLYNAWRWLWYMVAVSYGMTLLLEWPFVAVCLRHRNGWLWKSVWGSLVVQSASYLVLFGWYWAASGTSLYTGLTVVPPSAISLPKGVMLYYVAENGTDVYAYDPAQARADKLCELESFGNEDELVLQKSRNAAGRWDVIAGPIGNTAPRQPSPADRIVAAGLECDTAEPPSIGFSPGGDVPRFRADKSGWQFSFGWMADGLHGNNPTSGQRLDVSLETPFLHWYIGHPTQLPNGQVVFQLGWHQICVLDPNERKIALLVKGRWPVVTLEDGVKRDKPPAGSTSGPPVE